MTFMRLIRVIRVNEEKAMVLHFFLLLVQLNSKMRILLDSSLVVQ